MAAVPIMTEAEAMDVFRIAPPQRPSQDLIALRDLSIDPRYQREIAEGDVRRIARTFDELAFGVVYVSERIDRYTGTATYAIIDGQHRVEAARRARSEDWRAPVFVYRLKDNPYLIGCPCCGTTICAQCAKYAMQLSPDGLCGCAECDRYASRVRSAWKKHLATYDHETVDEDQARHRRWIEGLRS